MCILNKESLPVKINQINVESIIFNFFEISNFFVIGSKNTEFNKSASDINNSSLISDTPQNLNKTKNTGDEPLVNTSILFEKFFINNGDDLASQTLAYLQIGKDDNEIFKYCFSQNHEFMAVFTK